MGSRCASMYLSFLWVRKDSGSQDKTRENGKDETEAVSKTFSITS